MMHPHDELPYQNKHPDGERSKPTQSIQSQPLQSILQLTTSQNNSNTKGALAKETEGDEIIVKSRINEQEAGCSCKEVTEGNNDGSILIG